MLPTLIVFAYLLGSISAAIIVCRLFNLPDPRTQGSNNPGATNVLRIGGKKAAIITLLFDGLKGLVPVLIGKYLDFDTSALTWVALAAFLGHVYPVFFGFKGGKGIATFLGALLALNVLTGLAFGLTWLFVAKGLKISSLSALIATALTPLYLYFFTHQMYGVYVVILICVWIFFTHRGNIRRMVLGDEGKI
jgi:glycerol-3-phosphate acyltransferase PlsY